MSDFTNNLNIIPVGDGVWKVMERFEYHVVLPWLSCAHSRQ